MSNETANQSQAGLVLQVFADEDDDPIILGSWGIEEATLERGADGLYSVRLTQPGSALVNVDGIGFEKIGQLVTWGGNVTSPANLRFVCALVPDEAPVAGQPVNLPILLIAIIDNADSSADDGDGLISVKVTAIPQQD